MKKVLTVILAALLLAGCGGQRYVTGMYSDVRDYDAYESAVKLCVEKGYLSCEGDVFGAYEPLSLAECASAAVKLSGKETKNAISYAVENGIAMEDYADWDYPASREQAAYMISHAAETEEINSVLDGAIADVGESEAKEEIYHLYRAGIFAGDKEKNTFRPKENIVRAEMAIIIERVLDKSKRAVFSMDRLEASLIAFGDTIGHMPVVRSGQRGGGYNFDALFENVEKYVKESDIACINQETIFTDGNFTGYPAFGTPKEFGIAEYNAGFDVVTQATNHAFDKGERGILYTAKFWQDYPVKLLGIHESEADAEKIEVIEKNGIRLALLNYTYGLNGFRLPEGKEYLVDILDDKEKIASEVRRAREMSDGVIVFLHFGTEYRTTPSEEQREWARLFADEGVLAIIGTHPHVAEPLEIVEGKGGNLVPVYYSLGNFISSQNDLQCALCAMASFKIVKDEKGCHIEAAKIVPVITHMENNYYTAYLLDDYPKEMEARHKFKAKYPGKFSAEYMRELFDGIVN